MDSIRRVQPRRQAGGELVLVVDDDHKIASLVEAYLARAGFEVAVAHDGLTALRLVRELEPAIVVLDLMLPVVDGRGVARTVKEERDLPIIMLTALGSTGQRVAGLEAGADDYVAKPFEPSELVARVKAVLRRTRPAPARGVLHPSDLEVDADRRTVRRAGSEIALTAAEFDLLWALAAARGRVLSRLQLIDALPSGTSAEIGERSIDVYVRRLRAKLGDDAEQPRYIATVRGFGYQLIAQ